MDCKGGALPRKRSVKVPDGGDYDFLNIRRAMPPPHVMTAKACLERPGRLTAWELRFLNSILSAPGLNERQRAKLVEIQGKLIAGPTRPTRSERRSRRRSRRGARR
jgi:hypothetical protein